MNNATAAGNVCAAAIIVLCGAVVLCACLKRRRESLYSEHILRGLYARAQCAAAAWIDDIPEDAYLGAERARFIVKRRIICVQLRTKYEPVVDVFFCRKKGEWVRGKIFYKGVQVR